MIAKTWMEVLRLVNNHPGINITELFEAMKPRYPTVNRLILTGYLRCMEDIGLLTPGDADSNAVHLYSNGSSPAMLAKEFAAFQAMMDARRKKAQKRKNEQLREANRYIRNEDGSRGDDE